MAMERALMKELIAWKASPRRKPLVLMGARQVGKTWLMKTFGQRCYAKTAYINFDHNERMQRVFAQDFDIDRLLMALNAETGISITAGDTLIILDEVQEAPLALSSLKYFCENAPGYHAGEKVIYAPLAQMTLGNLQGWLADYNMKRLD